MYVTKQTWWFEALLEEEIGDQTSISRALLELNAIFTQASARNRSKREQSDRTEFE